MSPEKTPCAGCCVEADCPCVKVCDESYCERHWTEEAKHWAVALGVQGLHGKEALAQLQKVRPMSDGQLAEVMEAARGLK